jgi:riboflavin biosynthesis pyrimidine reductase
LADVILVGSGTVRAERYAGIELDPSRMARRVRWGLPARPPPIAVITNRGLPHSLPLFRKSASPPIIITTKAAAGAVPEGVKVIISGIDRVNLGGAIGAMAQAGLRHIHCEGGPALLGSLAAEDLLDECCLTLSPLMLGTGATRLLPVEIDDPVRWRLAGARVDGSHLFTRYLRVAR